jgi:hypothetical protein
MEHQMGHQMGHQMEHQMLAHGIASGCGAGAIAIVAAGAYYETSTPGQHFHMHPATTATIEAAHLATTIATIATSNGECHLCSFSVFMLC